MERTACSISTSPSELSRGGAPIIEDDVLIGANAVLLGNITVHKGAKIGAGAVVLSDVPGGATAVGVPAKMLLPKVS